MFNTKRTTTNCIGDFFLVLFIPNIGRDIKIPKAPDGHTWKGIVHNKEVTWLAYWIDNVNGAFKYIWLASSSKFKGQSDFNKYEKARELKKCIAEIRANYLKELTGRQAHIRQRATAIWLIDKLALRVGNEKDQKEVADTVGCCSLRVEHLIFKEGNRVAFDFLGKDSMRYQNEVEVDRRVFRNLSDFVAGKDVGDEIFDRLSTQSLNDHLKTLMPGLTAKVFRTYNASITLQKELFEKSEEEDVPDDAILNQKLVFYNRANREVAILCNHQRTVPKMFDTQMEKLVAQQAEVQKQMEELEEHLDDLKGGRKQKKEKKVKKEKGEDDDEENEKKRKRSNDPEKIQSQIEKLSGRLKGFEAKITMKSDTKTVALGTSKINYMDPRITVAWCKAKEVPIEKIFNKSLLSKFPWAMEVLSTWRF